MSSCLISELVMIFLGCSSISYILFAHAKVRNLDVSILPRRFKSHFFKENFKIDENGPITELKKLFLIHLSSWSSMMLSSFRSLKRKTESIQFLKGGLLPQTNKHPNLQVKKLMLCNLWMHPMFSFSIQKNYVNRFAPKRFF